MAGALVASFSCGKVATALPKRGDVIDSWRGVSVYFNGNWRTTSGRHKTKDGYNLGLKWQCVEFVKRFYYQHLKHKMPDPWGHAVSFFNKEIADGEFNKGRGLWQYANPSASKPQVDDLIVFNGNRFNPYGHVAIIAKVEKDRVQIIQQNMNEKSRETITLKLRGGRWHLPKNTLGVLRKNP